VITRAAREVYAKAFAVCLGVYLANRAVELYLQSRIHTPDLRWAIAFIVIQGCAITGLSFYLLALRTYGRLIRTVHGHIRAPIRDRVLALAFEGESWSANVPKHGPARRVLEESVAEALTTLRASARDRIARFAVEQGFQAEWIKVFSSRAQADRKRAISLLALISRVAGETILPVALSNEYPAIRAIAYRGLLLLGERQRIDEVFRPLLRESFIVRALLVNELKRHALYLLAETIPSVLASSDRAGAARCFEILVAWKSALPAFDIHPWTAAESDRELWPLVLALLPYVRVDDSVESFVGTALNSDDPAIQCAAAQAAGRLKLRHLVPLLSAALNREKRVAVAAANSIAQMGEAGERTLERIIAGPDRNAAAFAMEALEHVTVKAA
jgi:hypothetical protein